MDPALSGKPGYDGPHKLAVLGSGKIQVGGVNYDTAGAPTETFTDPHTGVQHTYFVFDFDWDASNGNDLQINVKDMDESQAIGDPASGMADDAGHLRQFQFVHADHWEDYKAGQIFDPNAVAEAARFAVIRLMNQGNPNLLAHKQDQSTNEIIFAGDGGSEFSPDFRYPPVDAWSLNYRLGFGGPYDNGDGFNWFYDVSSIPFEFQIAFFNAAHDYWANNLQTEGYPEPRPWFNIPSDATDARVSTIAGTIGSDLNAGVKFYVEFGNECWNASTDSYAYCFQKGKAVLDQGTYGPLETAAGYAAHRASLIWDIVATDSGRSADMVPVFGGFANDTSYINAAFDDTIQSQFTPSSTAVVTQLQNRGGSLAIGTYVGRRMGDDGLDLHLIRDRVLGNSAYTTVAEQAEALDRIFRFGLDDAKLYDLGTGAKTTPVTGIVYQPAMAISLHQIFWADSPGFENNNAYELPNQEFLDRVRVNGADLEYRVSTGDPWVKVGEFTTDLTAAGVDARQLFDDVQITGTSSSSYGVWYPMGFATLANESSRRLQHVAVANSNSIGIVGYEGGLSFNNVPDVTGADALYDYYVYGSSLAADLEQEYREILQANSFGFACHYKGHSRFYGDKWGAARYTGASAEGNAMWRFQAIVDWNNTVTGWV